MAKTRYNEYFLIRSPRAASGGPAGTVEKSFVGGVLAIKLITHVPSTWESRQLTSNG